MRQDENYPLRPVDRPVIGESETMDPRPQMNRQRTYVSCGEEYHSPGEMSVPRNAEASQRTVA